MTAITLRRSDPPARVPRPRLRRPDPAWTARMLPLVGAIAFVAAWEATGRAETFGTTWIPLSEIAGELSDPLRRPLLERAVTATFGRAALGFAWGVGAAVSFATVATLVPPLRRAIGRIAVSLNSIPWIALGPLLMVLVERDTAPAVIAGLAVFFQMFVATSSGFASVAREQSDLLAVLGGGRARSFVLLTLPTAIPSLLLGLKLAAPAALIGAIFGEWFGAERGIGLLLLTSMQNFDIPLLWSVALLAAAASMTAFGVLGVAERLAVRRFAPTATTPTAAIPARGGLRSLVATAAVVALGIVAWQVYVQRSGVSSILVPEPGAVGGRLVDGWSEYLSASWATIRTAVWGLGLGTLIGTTLAVSTWWSATLRGLLTPLVLVARSVPTLALMPVVAGILGYNDRTVIALAVLISFFPTFVFAGAGLRSLPAGSADLMAALGVPKRRVFRIVALPAAARQLLVAIRLSAGLCVVAAVVAEFMIGREGLGRTFSRAHSLQDMATAWGAALLIITLAMTAFALASWLERAATDRLT